MFGRNLRIKGSSSRTTPTFVFDVKKVPIRRPKSPDLTLSWSSTTLPFVKGPTSATSCRSFRLDLRPSWSEQPCHLYEEAPCLAETSEYRAMVVRNNLAFRVEYSLESRTAFKEISTEALSNFSQEPIWMHTPKRLNITINKLLLIKMYCF